MARRSFVRPLRPRVWRVWIVEHPALAALLIGLVLILGGLGGLGWRLEAQKQARGAAAYAGVALTARAVDVAIETHTLQEVRWYTLLADTAQATPIYNLTFRDGSHGWIETFALPDATKQRLRDTATTQSVRFTLAGTTVSTNPALDALGTLGLILALGIVLIGGQRWLLQGHSRMRFQAEGLNPDLTFDQIVGYEPVKAELKGILHRFHAFHKGQASAIKPPKGVLLVGPPGVGKTLFAKALANESNLAFFSLTGADFADTFVGVGPSRVRQLFARARQSGGALIFIDEIDAIGNRHQLSGGGDSERLAVINRLLAELDGINEAGRFLVVGATNYPERVDQALLRPGRLGLQIQIPLPDWATRKALLERSLGPHPTASLDLDALTARTTGLSGADLTQLVEEALALAQDSPGLTQEHLHQAHEKTLLGSTRCHPHPEEIRRVALHELGHALVGHLRCPHRVMDKITVQGRGHALGFTLHRPLDDRHLQTEAEMRGALAMLLAGRVAEQQVMGSLSDGAAGDLAEANRLAQRMVEDLGMGPTLGLATGLVRDPAVAALALADRQMLLRTAEQQAQADIELHLGWLQEWADRLIQAGTLEAPLALQALTRP